MDPEERIPDSHRITSEVPLIETWSYEADCLYALAAQMSAHARLEHRYGVPDWGSFAEHFAGNLRAMAERCLNYARRDRSVIMDASEETEASTPENDPI